MVASKNSMSQTFRKEMLMVHRKSCRLSNRFQDDKKQDVVDIFRESQLLGRVFRGVVICQVPSPLQKKHVSLKIIPKREALR